MSRIAVHASKVIDGLLYDTRNARVVAEGRYETLFKTPKDNFFIGYHSQYDPGEDRKYSKIVKLVDPSEWIAKHCDGETAVYLIKNLLGVEVEKA